MIKKLAVSAASVLTAAVITAFPMCASAFSVEQIQTEMPDINIFYTSDSGEGDVELMLDNVPLKTTEPQSFFDTGMPACYYLLIDDSGSVTAPQMEAVKNALKNNCTFIRDTDTVNIISIGFFPEVFPMRAILRLSIPLSTISRIPSSMRRSTALTTTSLPKTAAME